MTYTHFIVQMYMGKKRYYKIWNLKESVSRDFQSPFLPESINHRDPDKLAKTDFHFSEIIEDTKYEKL